ncbi:hypothetical protein D3C87_1944680 [compost metagenome]
MGYFLFTALVRKESSSAGVTFLQFFILVLILPNLICNYIIVAQYMAVGDYDSSDFWRAYWVINAVDILGGVFITYPLVFKVSSWLKKRYLSLWPLSE